MTPPPHSEALRDWGEIADRGWEILLLGNGMSINVSERFAYASLYQEAIEIEDGLNEHDQLIFEAFDTTNFEVVLAKLRDAISLAKILGRKAGPYRRRFRSVQEALGEGIRSVHLEWMDIPDSTLDEIREELERYRAIFTTSYDLLLYWAMAQGDNFDPFCDCFWANGRNEFSLDECEVFDGYVPVYYLHGALHLIVGGSGATRKLVKADRRLLEQFGEPLPDDPDARPLLISEGSARDKLQAIEGNDYLAHAYEALKQPSKPSEASKHSGASGPLLVFGHSLGDQDQHLIDAINANPNRPVAVSQVRQSAEEIREKQSRIWGKLRTEEVYFFDASTHPLGSPRHRIPDRTATRFLP